MSVDLVKSDLSSSIDSSRANEITFATSIGFNIFRFIAMLTQHVDCNAMIGLLVGFIVGLFAKVIAKTIDNLTSNKALERKQPKKPPDKANRLKILARLIVTFAFAFVTFAFIAILSSSATNTRI